MQFNLLINKLITYLITTLMNKSSLKEEVKVQISIKPNQDLMHGPINSINLMMMPTILILNMSKQLDTKVIMPTIPNMILITVVDLLMKLVMEPTSIIDTIATTITESITLNILQRLIKKSKQNKKFLLANLV